MIIKTKEDKYTLSLSGVIHCNLILGWSCYIESKLLNHVYQWCNCYTLWLVCSTRNTYCFTRNEQWREKYSGLSKETKLGLSVYISLSSLSLENWLQLKTALSNLIFLRFPAITKTNHFPCNVLSQSLTISSLEPPPQSLTQDLPFPLWLGTLQITLFLYEALTNPNW